MTTRDVAQLLGVSEATVKRWANAGELRHLRTTPRGRRQFDLSDVRAFLSVRMPASNASDPESAADVKIEESLARVRAMGTRISTSGKR